MKCPKCETENPETQRFCGDCGTQLELSEYETIPTQTIETPKEELTTGSTFARRYQIIEEIGKGGMGKVYKVLDKEVNAKIALKLIKPEIAANKKIIERFRNELRLARDIAHKNVCRMYDLNKEDGAYFITMEYVDGEDLKGLIRKMGRLSPGQAISIAKQVCDGLAEAHKLGVVHRDLKPQNIMIDRDGNARIMDFGIARSLRAKGITGSGVMIGTPEYMSPEQVEGKDTDKRSDIYSLGVILYEMVTGQVPFAGDTPFTIGVKHKSEIPQPPKELIAQIPNDLNSVILRCLEKDKEKRYNTVEELASELTSIEKGIPTTERVAPKRKPLTSQEITVQFSMKKYFVPVFIVLAVAIIGIVIWQMLPKKATVTPLSDKPSLAVMYFENQSAVQDLDRMVVNMLITNLSQIEGLDVVSSQRLFDIMRQLGEQNATTIDKTVATEIANRAGVNTMLLGSIMQLGDKIRIASQLIKVSDGAIIAPEQVEGNKIDDIFGMVDELATKISSRLGAESDGIAQDLSIADATTNSLEAYRYYQKGLEYLWEWNFVDAKSHLEKAIEIDPTFAMAYLFLATAEARHGLNVNNPFTDISQIKNILAMAKKYSVRVTERERLLIDLNIAFLDRNFDISYEKANEFVEKYPKDKFALQTLAGVAWMKLDFEKCIETYEKILEIDPTDANAYNIIAYSHSYLNEHEEAISAVKKPIALQPDNTNTYDSAWEIHMNAGRFDEALSFVDEGTRRLPGRFDGNNYAGYTFLLKGDAEAAREKFRMRMEKYPNQSVFQTRLIGFSYLMEGKYEEALSSFKKALELAQENKNIREEIFSRMNSGKILLVQKKYDQALQEFAEAERLSWKTYDESFNPIPVISQYWIGFALAEKGDFERATKRAGQLKGLIEKGNYDMLHLDFYYLLLGEIHIAHQNGQAAQEALDKLTAWTHMVSPVMQKIKASTLVIIGDFEKAIEAYKDFYTNVQRFKYGMSDPFSFFYEHSFADYNIAKIYEKTGNAEKAIEHYEKFLDLMKAADPGIKEVEDAKASLAKLK